MTTDKCACGFPHVTLEEYKNLEPYQQGFVQYMQGDHVGSELKKLNNHYPIGTLYHDQWNEGQKMAVIQAQDSEE